MPYYMLQAAYTPEALAAMVQNPQNRLEALRPVVEKLGGRIEGGWLAFGEHDVVLICQMPNNVSAAAFSMAGAAGGATRCQDDAAHDDGGSDGGYEEGLRRGLQPTALVSQASNHSRRSWDLRALG